MLFEGVRAHVASINVRRICILDLHLKISEKRGVGERDCNDEDERGGDGGGGDGLN